jgi:hypothetical protein
LAWQPQALDEPAHGRHADPETGHVSRARAHLRSGGLGLIGHQLMALRLGGPIHTWRLTTSVPLGGNGASRPVPAQQLFNQRKANAKDVGERPLRAHSTRVGRQDVWSPINRIASHTSYASGTLPSAQAKTALEKWP